MFDDYRRCNTCIHYECIGDCTKCIMRRPAVEFQGLVDGCGCVAYQFDVNGDCKYCNYDFDKRSKINGAQ